jgi:CMP-N-acetylneuraminic acid synthetase
MKTILIMPVKFKSNRLKNKNILSIKNMPMFIYSLLKVINSKKIDKFYVSTESKKIINICKKYNINFIKRPYYLSKDNTEKQEVIVHALKYLSKKKIKPKIVISYQANSPETKLKDLDNAINFFNKKLFPNYPIKELISVGKDNIQNAAFRIMTFKAAFQKTLSTKIGIFFTDSKDIHTIKEYQEIKKKLEKK